MKNKYQSTLHLYIGATNKKTLKEIGSKYNLKSQTIQ
jgi:hypothetical protein